MDKLSVVIPVYGCRSALFELHERLTNTLKKLTNDYEIILVNDNCPQNSWEVIEEICHKDKQVIGVELSRNFGQSRAIMAGLDVSYGDWVVVMDCDLQDRPEEIEKLYSKALEGYDVVVSKRLDRKDSLLVKTLSKKFYKVYSWMMGFKYDETICNFSIASRKVIDSYCQIREIHCDYSTYIQWLGFRQAYVGVETEERHSGKSSYTFGKKLNLAFDILTSQSDKLLRLMAYVGFFISLISFLAIILLVIQYFTSNVDTGWTSIIATICLMSGLIIMTIGIVGIYVGNIFMQVKNRPLYIVRQQLNGKEN